MDRRTMRKILPACLAVGALLFLMTRLLATDGNTPVTRDEERKTVDQTAYGNFHMDPITDTRPTDCKTLKYKDPLPDISIVLLLKKGMHDSVVVRALKSIVTRTKVSQITEIIVVHSDMPDKVLEAVTELGISLVKFVSIDGEPSWMKMRLNAGVQARAPVVVFLDGNSEVNVGWLEPLIEAVKADEQKIAIPHLDGIDDNTFDYNPITEITRTIFDWKLSPIMFEVGFEELMTRNTEMDPLKTPTMTGMSFAISKGYLEHISKHLLHPELTAIEVSFFVWLCGGSMEIIPCSRIGKGKLFEVENDFRPRHLQQVAEGWLDEYKKYYYSVATAKQASPEDIIDKVDQIKGVKSIRSCKKFDQFLKTVATDVIVPPDGTLLYGTMKSKGGQTCFSASIDDHLLSTTCAILSVNREVFVLTNGLVRIGEKCASAKAAGYIRMEVCDANDAHQKWKVEETGQLSIAGEEDKRLCMMHATDPSPEKKERQIIMAHQCDGEDGKLLPFQQWEFSNEVQQPTTNQ